VLAVSECAGDPLSSLILLLCSREAGNLPPNQTKMNISKYYVTMLYSSILICKFFSKKIFWKEFLCNPKRVFKIKILKFYDSNRDIVIITVFENCLFSGH